MIASRLYLMRCEEHYEELSPGKVTDKNTFGIDNRVYKPNYDI